jgi:hypothetical protein
MRNLLRDGALVAGIYGVGALLAVLASRLLGPPLWVAITVYVGPPAYFVIIAVRNRAAFASITNRALRCATLLSACCLLTLLFCFLVFVLSVNAHLAMGGHF